MTSKFSELPWKKWVTFTKENWSLELGTKEAYPNQTPYPAVKLANYYCFFLYWGHMVKMWSTNSLQEIQKIKSTFEESKYLCSCYQLAISFCTEKISLSFLNRAFLLKKIYFALLFYISFALAHGKDLVEEIKSETSGDLQTTLIKLAEVWDSLISMTKEANCFYSSTGAHN